MDILSNLPALRGINDPTLTLDFTVPGTLPSGVVFARASTATYFDSTGTMQTAATNAPRWDYDPTTHALNGLLIEEARSNVLLQSSNIANAAWSVIGFTVAAPVVTANQATAPDGTVTAAKVVIPAVSAAGNASIIYQQPTVTAAVYTLSLYMRGSVGGEQLYLTASSGTGFYYNSRFTLTTAWQRFSFTPPAMTAAGWFFEIGTDLRDGTQTSTPAQTIFVWGGQLELGAFPTSYIPTTAAAVTRAQDSCTIPPANMGFFTPPGGTWMAEFIAMMNAGKNNRIIGMNAGGTAQSPLFTNITTNTLGQYDSLGAVNTANTVTFGAVMRGASTYTPSTGQTCLNGGAVATGALTSGYAVLATNGVRFLADAGGLTPTTGYIRRVNYWTRVLSAAELQTVTGLPSADFDFTTPGVLPVGVTFVRPAPATYTDSAGVIRPSPSGTPRWDYDPITHVLLGLLIEDSRTNATFPSTNWASTRAPSGTVDGITQNVGVSPSGATDAMAFIPGAFSGVHQFYMLQPGAVSTTYTYSVYVKAAGMNFVGVSLENSAFVPSQGATFNLANGTVDMQSLNSSATIQAAGNGWYRCAITATSVASGSNNYVSNIRPGAVGGSIVTTTGDGVNGVWVWGQQYEAGTYLTSLIPTTTVAVTRWADVVNIPIANVAGFNPNAGSLVHQYISKGSLVGYGAIAQLVGSNAATDYISVDETTAGSATPTTPRIAGGSVVVGGTSLSYTTTPTLVLVPPNVIRRGATSWAAGAYVASAHNGGAGTQGLGPAASMPVITTLQVGGLMHYQNPWSQWAQRIRYWPRQLPTSDLQALTIAPTLDLDFMNAGTLPPGVTYARASPATYFDATGTLQVSAYNLVRNSMMVGGVSGAPGSSPTYWANPQTITGSGNTTTFTYGTINGVPYVDVTVNVVSALGAATAVSIQPETVLPYTSTSVMTAASTFQLVGGALPAGITFNNVVWYLTSPGFVNGFFTPTATPQRIVTTGSANASTTSANYFITITCPASLTYSFTLRITQPQVENGTVANNYTPTTGTASGAPRWDYDPVTKTLNGLLIEGLRTNLALQSADLSNAAWLKGTVTVAAPVVTGNNTAAPDGTTTASRVVYPAVPTGTNTSIVYQQSVVTAAVYAFSIWLKGNVGGEVLYLHATPDAITYYRQACTLTTQWQRFTLVTGTLTATSWVFGVGNDARATGPSTLAQTIYAWGGQLELGQFATSYIPTTTVAVARVADTVQMPTGAWFSPAASTMSAEYIYPRGPDTTTAHDVVGLNDAVAPNGNRMVLRALPGYNPTAMMFSNTAPTVVNLVFAGAPTTGVSRSAGTWTAGAMTGVLNGNVVAGAVSGLPSNISQMTFGNQALADDGSLMGWVRHVSYWPRIQTDPDLLATSGASVVDRTRVLVMG